MIYQVALHGPSIAWKALKIARYRFNVEMPNFFLCIFVMEKWPFQ